MNFNSLLSEWVKTLISRWLKRGKFVKFAESDKRELIPAVAIAISMRSRKI
jgi:hypothetical protein